MRTDNVSERIRKTAAVLLIAAVFGSLSGCLVKEGNEETVPSGTSATQAAPTATPTPTPEPSPTPTPTPTPVPTPVPEYVEPQFSETWYNGFVDARSVRATIVEDPNDVAVLVNKYYALPEDYVPDDLVTAPHSMNQQLRQEACDAWEAMYDACLDATGQGLYLVSGYRDYYTLMERP